MEQSVDELRQWLALSSLFYYSGAAVLRLLEILQTPAAILAASSRELKAIGVSESVLIRLAHPDWERVDHCLDWARKSKGVILHWQDRRYPALLREIYAPPLVLFTQGDVGVLQEKQLAIVGARRPTSTGLEIAYQLAGELAECGLIVTSGLARGIDGAAHKGALAGGGKTIAVLGAGLDRIYPTSHQVLAETLLEKGGLLVSEFFLGVPPRPEHFPRRNRIMSGLSLGVIVVEAALRSGSLITAHYALEQGREVMAVPGSIRNPLSQGCHALLKQGATLIETYQDVLQGLNLLDLSENPQSGGIVTHEMLELDSQDRKLVECLGFETTPIDSLVVRTGFRIEELLVRLATLELEGFVAVVPGGYVRKCKDGKKSIDCRVAC